LNDDEFKNLKEKLMQIKGIGEKAATGIIIQTNGLKNFHSAKALAAFLGLVPTIKQSGTSLKAEVDWSTQLANNSGLSSFVQLNQRQV
jgi:transposase